MGSFYADIYQGAGNLSECLFTGRTAGVNAARVKKDVSAFSAPPGNRVNFKSESLEDYLARCEAALRPGEYLGVGSGMGRELVVKVAVNGSDITGIEFLRVFETVGIADRAVVQVPRAIIRSDSTRVDTVAGATVTSLAIIEAVNDAMSDIRESLKTSVFRD
jgi:uncharacterized protein with FMN-binding domain